MRHHSPACSWQLARLIRDWRPQSILIEGPRDATEQIPLLLHAECRAPVAFFTTYVNRPLRHCAYYPLCDYSPELVALREGRAVGAKLRFIDLTFPEMVEAERAEVDPGLRSLLRESHLSHSRRLAALAERVGARDFDDLWDQLFEVRFRDLPAEQFIEEVLAWCRLARQDYSQEMLENDGTLARERGMAWEVNREKGTTLVVTGGFHSLALPETEAVRPQPVKVPPDDALVVLMEYSFIQLDRLNGYASGMPSPHFYQHGWEGGDPAELLVRLSRELRDASTADAIGALDQARRLAALRGHREMSREDLLDGVRSCLCKGSLESEGKPVLAAVHKLLAGERVGRVPPEAGQPPLLRHFHETARSLKLATHEVAAKEVRLDLYRKGPDRLRSRFFHQLRFLGVPFAQWKAGPDFVAGQELERVQEVWSYRWQPACTSGLIELSVKGATLQEAAGTVLAERLDQPGPQRADRATGLLLEACRMGLHQLAPELLGRIEEWIGHDPHLSSLVRALEELQLLGSAREPLEAHDLPGLDRLCLQAYYRACFVLPELIHLNEEQAEAELESLQRLAQSALRLEAGNLREVREAPLRLLAEHPDAPATLQGGAAALLFGDDAWSAERLALGLRGQLWSGDPRRGAGFLRGLLRCGRSVLWQVDEVVELLDQVLREWTEDQFLEALPELRLGFSQLTPRECHRLADRIGGGIAVSRVRRDYREADLLAGVALNRELKAQLRADGLADWL